jgi:hypothetical protein
MRRRNPDPADIHKHENLPALQLGGQDIQYATNGEPATSLVGEMRSSTVGLLTELEEFTLEHILICL